MGQYYMNFPQENLKEALTLIKGSIQGEREDELFYDYLIKLAPTKEEKGIIESIRDDEKRHNMIFRRIYKDFTREEVGNKECEDFKKPKSYIEGIKRALIGELAAAEKYKRIRQGLPYTQYRELLFGIITDEIRHSILYNYILYLNSMHKGNMGEIKGKVSRSVDKFSTSINEATGVAIDKAREKLKEEKILENIVIPGIILGVRNAYSLKGERIDSKDRLDIKQDVATKYVADVVELLLGKVKEKVDLESFFQQYVVPQLIKD
jgi:rubrerythrin